MSKGNYMNTALTIAGSDCSGGAGIQADLKTFAAHKVYGMSAITALTAQNTLGVTGISESSPEFLTAQLADVITPNIPETEVLTEMTVDSADSMEKAAIKIYENLKSKGGHAAVLVKGGHAVHTANDCLCVDGRIVWLNGERVDNPNTHGTGCTLSSAIAANLAQGLSIEGSVKAAKEYLTGALKAGLNLGSGSGPLDHTYWLYINK